MKRLKKRLPSSTGQLLKSTELAQVVQENSVLGMSWFCAILFTSYITQKLLFHLTAASQSLPSNTQRCFPSLPQAQVLPGEAGANHSSWLHVPQGHREINAFFVKPQGCCEDCSLEFKFSYPPPKHKLNKSWSDVSKAGPIFQAFFHINSWFSLPLAQSHGDHLLLMVTAGSMSKSDPSYERKYFIITNIRIDRKRKTRKSQELSVATVFGKKYNPKCIESTTCLSTPIKASRKWEVPWHWAFVSINRKSKAVPWADNLCSWPPEFQASTGEIYNVALTA